MNLRIKKINKINNTILNQEKELNKIINLKEAKNEVHFGLLCNSHLGERFSQEFHKLMSLERNYGFLSSIQTKLLVSENSNEIEGFIKAPDNSPYKDGIFNFLIKYPNNYPERAPIIILKTEIFHCNVSKDGRCCINHLLDKWDKNYDISMILSFLYEFFIRNNPHSPYRRDLAELYIRNYNSFLEKCQKFVNLYAFKQFNKRLNYMFPNYTNIKLEFSNSNLIFVYNSKFITISKDKIKDKNIFDIGNILGINLKDKAFIIGNKVFDSEIEFQDYLRYNISYHIIYVIPLIWT